MISSLRGPDGARPFQRKVEVATTTTTTTTTATLNAQKSTIRGRPSLGISRRLAGAIVICCLTFITKYSSGQLAEHEHIKPAQQYQECSTPSNTLPAAYCRSRADQNHTLKMGTPIERTIDGVYERVYRLAESECRKAIALTGEPDEWCHHWRYRYTDEHKWSGFEAKVADSSIDERLANSLYSVITSQIVNMDLHPHTNKLREEEEMRSMEGPEVDERQCGEQLAKVLAQIAELSGQLDMKRSNASHQFVLEPKHIHLARYLDSFGRYESGLLAGKTHLMGTFDQCITNQLLLPKNSAQQRQQQQQQQQQQQVDKVKTRYCWARMSLDKHLKAELRERKATPFEAQEKVLLVAACLPLACHSRSFLNDGRPQRRLNRQLAQQLIDTQFQLPKSLFLDQSLAISTINCLPDADSQYGLPLSGKLLVGFLAVWCLLAAYSTYHQEFRSSRAAGHKKRCDEHHSAQTTGASWTSSLLDCLNMKRSWQDFVEEPYDELRQEEGVAQLEQQRAAPRRVNLDVLNPVKAFGCGFVVLGHAVIMQTVSSMGALRVYNIVENDPGVLFMTLGTVIVDTFFVITGVLLAYVALRKSVRDKRKPAAPSESSSNGSAIESRQQQQQQQQRSGAREPTSQMGLFLKHWARFAVQRHLRLLPLFFLIYWFKRSYLIYATDKPLWDPGFNKDTLYGACKQESWLVPFTLMNSFLPLSKQCLPQGWSITVDLFFSLAVTPLVLLLTKRPKLALGLLALMMVVSHGWILSAYKSAPGYMISELGHLRTHGFVLMFGHLHHLYTYPHFRLTSVLVGLVVGYLLHLYQENEQAQWPHWLRAWATKGAIGVTASLFLSISMAPITKVYLSPYEAEVFTQLFTTGRVIWAVSNGILFLRMATDWRHTFLMRQFAAPYWSKLVKLNLAILLIHLDVLVYQIHSLTTLVQFNKLNIFIGYASAYLFCIPVAIILHVLFENPIDKLIRRHLLPHILT